MATTAKFILTSTPQQVSDGTRDAFLSIDQEQAGDLWFFSTSNSTAAYHTVRQTIGRDGSVIAWASTSISAGFPVYAWCAANCTINLVVSTSN